MSNKPKIKAPRVDNSEIGRIKLPKAERLRALIIYALTPIRFRGSDEINKFNSIYKGLKDYYDGKGIKKSPLEINDMADKIYSWSRVPKEGSNPANLIKGHLYSLAGKLFEERVINDAELNAIFEHLCAFRHAELNKGTGTILRWPDGVSINSQELKLVKATKLFTSDGNQFLDFAYLLHHPKTNKIYILIEGQVKKKAAKFSEQADTDSTRYANGFYGYVEGIGVKNFNTKDILYVDEGNNKFVVKESKHDLESLELGNPVITKDGRLVNVIRMPASDDLEAANQIITDLHK